MYTDCVVHVEISTGRSTAAAGSDAPYMYVELILTVCSNITILLYCRIHRSQQKRDKSTTDDPMILRFDSSMIDDSILQLILAHQNSIRFLNDAGRSMLTLGGGARRAAAAASLCYRLLLMCSGSD